MIITITEPPYYIDMTKSLQCLQSGDIFRLQKVLGHSDLAVVKEYVQMFGNDLAVDFDKFNPLDRTVAPNGSKKLTMTL